MVSNLVVYQLALIALVWLLLIRSWLWPSEPAAARPLPPTPVPPLRKRSTAPTPFPGLTRKPHCDACEQTIEDRRLPLPSAPPPKIIATRGRRRHSDTSRHFCPDADGRYGGWVGLGHLQANGHPSGGPWRPLHCPACKGYCQETHGTLFHGQRVAPDLLVWAVGALVEGLGMRAVARVCEVDPNPVPQWVVEAAEQLWAFSQYFLHDVRVTQVQLDELLALLRAVKDGEGSGAEALTRLAPSPHWVWAAIDPVTTRLRTIDSGDRTLAMAQRVVQQVVQVVAPGCVPLLLTDGFKEYTTALLTHCGQWVPLPRSQATGPAPQPRWMPLPQLLDAQVVKTVRRWRLVRVRQRVVFGTLEAVEQVLAACGWQSQTAFVERLTLDIRQRVAAVGRRGTTLCKGEDGVRHQLVLFHAYHNVCLPHASWRGPLAAPGPTNGTGSAKMWRPWTPAMAAGLTDHVWTLREVLLLRVPPWPQPAGM